MPCDSDASDSDASGLHQGDARKRVRPQESQVKMPIQLPDQRVAVRTVLVERISGKEHVLFERPGRSCHFAQDFRHGEHIVCLRVDWRDLWYLEPTLDADIYERGEGGHKGRRLPNREWHHTRLSPASEEDIRSYSFKFRDLELELIARKTLAASVGLSMYIVDQDGKPL